jgi:hypothetical protein
MGTIRSPFGRERREKVVPDPMSRSAAVLLELLVGRSDDLVGETAHEFVARLVLG